VTKRIFKSILWASIAVLLISLVMIFGFLYSYFNSVSLNQVKIESQIVSKGVEDEGMQFLEGLDIDGYRITWIASDGTVIYDSTVSDVSTMENHLDREEVQEAMETGYGESQRLSSTIMEKSIYCARLLDDGTVVRVSVTQYSVLTVLLGMLTPVIVVLVIAVILSLVFAKSLSKKVVKPLNDLDLNHPLENQNFDELAPLLRRINSQQVQLEEQKEELSRRQDELDTVLGSMKEGIILLKGKGQIMSINGAAMSLLGTDESCIGEDMLTVNRNYRLQEMINSGLSGKSVTDNLSMNGRIYQTTVSPVVTGDSVAGAAVFLMDVTDKVHGEEMRREFSANVSHELKTPLQSISGYAELLMNGMVKKEDIEPFASKIYDESHRLMQLVEDIISLSHLDEGGSSLSWGSVSLLKTAEDVKKRLVDKASEAQVTLDVSGTDAVIEGVPQLVEEIIYNLCDNSIKYNRPGGKVWVKISEDEETASISVRDNGIGIPEGEKDRIFERFYRVDKSHSKAVGGTGLGLSIVKHAVMIHGGEIAVTSKVGRGTDMVVTLPKKRKTEQ
jgi:two-component system phosphate regulon sensor histidine kinase PhoR